jgi:hypothetical protein
VVEQFAAPPINPLISIQPLSTAAANRDATAVPAQLTNTPPGTLVEGYVINRDAQSNPVVRTQLGDILVKTDVFIKTGSEVIFRVDATQPGHARLISIDGLSPHDYAAQQGRPISGDTVNATGVPSSGAGAPTNAAAGRTQIPAQPLQAVLVSLPQAASPAAATAQTNPLQLANVAAATPLPAALAKLQQGATLRVKVLQVTLPQIAARPVAPTPATPIPAATVTAGATGATPAIAAGPAPTTNLPQVDKEIALPSQTLANAKTAKVALEQTKIVLDATAKPAPAPATTSVAVADRSVPTTAANIPAATAEKQPAPATAKQQPVLAGIPAQVIGHEKGGATILQTRIGTLKMQLPQPLPIGSSLQVELEVMPQNPPTASGGATTIGKATTLAQHWPALEETLAWSTANAPDVARALSAQIPTIGPKLASGLLFFIAAVKGGDVRQWLGSRAVQTLEDKSPGLLGKLRQDMGQLQQLLTDSPLQQWNSIMLPMLFGDHLEHARLFLRRDPEQDGGEQGQKKGREQRFILEVGLSDLGEVQFDGFVRGVVQAKQFDLIVRSDRPFSVELSEAIRTTFDTAMQTTGMKGYLGFQVGSQHFVRPLATDSKGGDSGSAQPILA